MKNTSSARRLFSALALICMSVISSACDDKDTNTTRGEKGDKGDPGINGTNGVDGRNGVDGAPGAAGSIGPMGLPGAPGEPAPRTYAYIFNDSAQVVAIAADIAFSTNGTLTTGMTHTAGASAIVVSTAGIYRADWIISAVEPNQFALTVNGVVAAGATYGSGAGTQQSSGQTLVALAAGDSVTVRNIGSSSAVTLQTLAGGTTTNVNASIILVQQ